MTLSGRCLCEGVTYEIRGPVRGVVNCHCSRCRRHTGHFMAATQAAADDVVISGDGLTWYDATDEVQYGFCGTCGSTMFWRTAAHPDRISIAAGTLTPPTGLETIGTIYRNYASDYHVFDESVPNHGEDFPEVQMTATLSLDDLARDPHPILASLRSEAPVAWVESLDAWLVTSHQLCTEVMLDAETFTVDDPRFSTQQVIGPSMLSLDGTEHRRHRDPFAPPFRAANLTELRQEIEEEASRLIEPVVADGGGDLRSRVAAPLAVSVMAGVLDLDDVAVADLLGWYEAIVSAVHEVTAGNPVPRSGLDAFDELKGAVSANLTSSRLLGPVDEEGSLDVDEIVSNVAVLLFGGVVTSESSTAIAFHHLLADPEIQTALRADSSAVKPFVEETFRIEPSAAAVDRYATRDVDLAGAAIAKGDLVRVSLSAANRDPAVFPDPDRLDWTRDNLGRSLTFARGPHACLGIHLARLETIVAIEKLLDTPGPLASPGLEPVEGLVFRVPISVEATWPGSDVSGG